MHTKRSRHPCSTIEIKWHNRHRNKADLTADETFTAETGNIGYIRHKTLDRADKEIIRQSRHRDHQREQTRKTSDRADAENIKRTGTEIIRQSRHREHETEQKLRTPRPSRNIGHQTEQT
jgi:hypothetical protein